MQSRSWKVSCFTSPMCDLLKRGEAYFLPETKEKFRISKGCSF